MSKYYMKAQTLCVPGIDLSKLKNTEIQLNSLEQI